MWQDDLTTSGEVDKLVGWRMPTTVGSLWRSQTVKRESDKERRMLVSEPVVMVAADVGPKSHGWA